MDNKTHCKIPDYGGLPVGRIVVGAKQLRKAVCSGRVSLALLARDADPALTQPLAALCAQKALPLQWIGSMRELGSMCGIEVGASAAAVLSQ